MTVHRDRRSDTVHSVSLAALLLAGCGFAPDLSRFPNCRDAGECPSGSLCLTQENRCVPRCGENCASSDAGTDAGSDAGFGVDAGLGLALSSRALPAAIETKPWAFTFAPTGGQGAYSFKLDGGIPGFSLSVGGQLATPAAPTPGTFPFFITVEDEAQPRGQVTTGFTLVVQPLLRIASGVLVAGRQGQPYFEQLSATGGSAPFRWVLDGGLPPAGVSLNADGGVQGSPTASSVVSFGVTVSDSSVPPQQASRVVTLETRLLDVVLAIATRGAADGRVGTPYSQPLKAYGGSPAYTWSVQTGSASLPPGLTLTNAGSAWQVSGTPTVVGTFDFTIRCVDSALGSQSQALRLVVY